MIYIAQAIKALATAAIFSQVASAHPGHDVSQEIAERNDFYKNSKRDLSHCSEALKKRGQDEKQRTRRQAAIEKARAARGLPQKRTMFARDTLATNISHHSTLDVNPDTTPGVEEIIYGNSSCLLAPEGEIGPFYVGGEFVRQNIIDAQPGISTIIDAQFIDVNTCEPVENLMWDVWMANSTGVYGGVLSSTNGNGLVDQSNINKTFLRGLQPTDADGVATFATIFPGHYSGRATHIHVVGRLNGTILSNGTYSGGSIAHIGQLFFDQDLITEVNTFEPYADNEIAVTLNTDDRVVSNEMVNDADPFFNYVLLGDDASDGIFAWVSLGINTTATYSDSGEAALLTANGGTAITIS